MSGEWGAPDLNVSDRAELERRLVRAERRRAMTRAGGLDPAQLFEQAQRIFAWLVTWDAWTVDGVIEVLEAAHRAGRDAACGDSHRSAEQPRDKRRVEP